MAKAMSIKEAAKKCSTQVGRANWKILNYRNYRSCVAVEMARSRINNFTFRAIYNRGYDDGYSKGYDDLAKSEYGYD